ncbi:protein FAM133A isoform X4 [Aedes aegypti]|uniref:Pleiotrophin/Midkine C-terminal domain-containing protein n=1 Tax=Aedes aegypti TaxID=7159 RepID=A0A6I8T392_AEDAE|nr:protein FAM133A isoform X4 [Aedes aegypti]
MNILVISFLALASLTTFPTQTLGTPAAAAAAASTSDVSESKKSLPDAGAPVNDLSEFWQEDDREVLIRNERGTKNGGVAGKKDRKKDKHFNSSPTSSSSSSSSPSSSGPYHNNKQNKQQNPKSKPESNRQAQNSQCRYTKGPWTECDAKSNTRSRTLSLKKGEQSCVQTRTIQKKCKKSLPLRQGRLVRVQPQRPDDPYR